MFDGAMPIISALLLGLKIEIFRGINSFISYKLTNWENYEKQSIANREYIIKYFSLEWINNFSFGFFILFFKVKFLKLFY